MSTIIPTHPTAATESAWAPPAESLFRMSLDQYEAMVASGVFSRGDRLHLIRGLLVAKMTQNTPHSTADLLCGDALEVPSRLAGTSARPSPSGSPVRRASPSLIDRWRVERSATIAATTRIQATSLWSSRWRIRGCARPMTWPASTEAAASLSTGSSTSSIARSRSTPIRSRAATGRAWNSSPARPFRSSSPASRSVRLPLTTSCPDGRRDPSHRAATSTTNEELSATTIMMTRAGPADR